MQHEYKLVTSPFKHAFQKNMIPSLLEGIFEFFFFNLWCSDQFYHDKLNLAKKTITKYFLIPLKSFLVRVHQENQDSNCT